MRCDRGDMPVDHHTIFLAGMGEAKFNHAAFEVENIDDLMRGRAVLEQRGAQSVWGVGRHILGSQVFDYWRDPWGHMIEHWTDGDLFDASQAACAPADHRASRHDLGPAPAIRYGVKI